MYDMTLEQQAQVIGIIIFGIGALFTWFRARLRTNAEHSEQRLKEQSDLHEQRIKDIEANRDKEKQELNLRLVEIEASRETEKRLFELNAAHAKSYNIVAHTQEQLRIVFGDRLAENTAQMEILSAQVSGIAKNTDAIPSTMGRLTDTLNAYLITVKSALLNVQQEIADAMETSSSAQDARLQKIFIEINSIHGILNQIQKQNDSTQPIPVLATPDELSDSNENDNPKKKDIA